MAQLIELQNQHGTYRVVRDDWNEDDFQDRARDYLNRELTPSELHAVMIIVADRHDANIGINWEVIDIAFESLGLEDGDDEGEDDDE